MSEHNADLNWLLVNHGDFLEKFGITKDIIAFGHHEWSKENKETPVIEYLGDLLGQALLLIAKNSNTEVEYYTSKLQIEEKMLELSLSIGKENRHYLLQQIHFDKLMISKVTLPFKFDIQINSDTCCSHCVKKDKKIFSFEKVLEKKYLPFTRCINKDGCCCSYSIVPLSDENGILIPNDWC